MPSTQPPANLAQEPPADDAGRYLALQARDARFDGRFFTGVTSTGIYCRPVCRVRTPKAENCRFFERAAQAEDAGFRPCLRCRPELAPAQNAALHWSTQDASAMLALQAADLMEHPAQADDAPSIATIAARLGISDRHLRRIFEAHWGITPLRYLQTRRLLTAKQLLTDTRLPVADVAALSGFASVRRFNAVFVQHYRLQPTALRKSILLPSRPTTASPAKVSDPVRDLAPEAAAFRFQAAYRPPFNVQHLLDFFANRAIAGVESVDAAKGLIRRSISLPHKATMLRGWVQAQWAPDPHRVQLRISESLASALPVVLNRMHAWLDLDADPAAMDPLLCTDFPGTEGMRVPGTMDGLELAVRAILGQQITVKAARTLTARLVHHCGVPLARAPEGLERCFPDAATLAALSPDVLGRLGIVKQRQQAILSLAQAVQSGELQLQPGGDVPATMAQLQSLPGIGAWTAHYIALRALRWPDAFPSGDVALQSALGVREASNPAAAADALSQRWRPWRGYATVRAWQSLSKT
ncbi:putative bifunctional transcriptional activator/DNA repair enzyme AlkA [Comamonadaceae bacterium OS-4]|nr:putative bifunctional transcriptional activator/DNA repair enzyme AlkA [Comamonadaceae bacterium OS-4]